MNTVLFTAFIAFVIGGVIGTIAGAMLGGGRVMEIHDELDAVRKENETLKARVDGPQVIEIEDKRPEAADITKNYFTEF